MGILTKKIYRDIRYNKGRSLAIIIIIALAAGLYSGLLLAYENVDQSFSDTEEQLNIESARFILGNYTPTDAIELDGFSSIANWDYRLSILTGIRLDQDSKETYTAPLHGVPGDRMPRVNNIEILNGDYFSSADDETILITSNFVDKKNLSPGSSIYVLTPDGVTAVSLQAEIFSPEFLYNVNPKTGLPDLTGLAPSWMTLNHLQEIFNLPDVVNEVVVRFEEDIQSDDTKLKQAINDVKTELSRLTPNISVIELDEEADQKMKEGDLGALDDFARVFGGVVLLIALFAIYDNISKLITNQRNYIGTMRALGGSKKKVVLHYTSMASLLGLFGVMLSIPLGWYLGYLMTGEYAHILGIPKPSTAFQFTPFVESVIINQGLSMIIAFFSSLRAASIQPREAMSSAFITMVFSSKPFFEKLFSKIPGFKSPTSTIPIRTLFRNRKKTLLTIFTWAISLVLMISALGFMDTFDAGLQNNYDNYQKYDLEIYFEQPLDPNFIDSILDQIDGIKKYENFVSNTIEVSNGEIAKSTYLYGYQSNSSLREFNIESNAEQDLILSTLLANQLSLSKGQKVQIMSQELEITAVSDEIISESVFMSLSRAQGLMGLENNVTGLIMTIDGTVDEKDIKFQMQENLPISVIISTQEVKNSIEYLIQGLMAMIGVMVLIGFVTIALFSFNTIVLEVMQREMEFVNLRSLGSSKKKILKIIVLQSLVISVIGSILSIPLGYYIAKISVDAMMEGLMILPTVIYPRTYAIAIATAFVASLTGIIAAYRHVTKMDLVNALRTRTNN